MSRVVTVADVPAVCAWADSRDLFTQGQWADAGDPYFVMLTDWAHATGSRLPDEMPDLQAVLDAMDAHYVPYYDGECGGEDRRGL